MAVFKPLSGRVVFLRRLPNALSIALRPLASLTPTEKGLMEFFDNEKNWGANYIVHGRSWRKEEIRLKSNIDIQKLWFVLLKERNMLLTMQEEYRRQYEVFPNPERIDKVELSMENILEVVKERDVAVNMLNKGRTGLNLPYKRINKFGFTQLYFPSEYLVPWYLNGRWKNLWYYTKLPEWSKKYSLDYAQKVGGRRRRAIKFIESIVQQKIKEDPQIDVEFVRSELTKRFPYLRRMTTKRILRRPLPQETVEGDLYNYIYDPDYEPKIIR
ncbi:hypothetical protein ACOME3_000455 [Neoechinorhynchus agilis]